MVSFQLINEKCRLSQGVNKIHQKSSANSQRDIMLWGLHDPYPTVPMTVTDTPTLAQVHESCTCITLSGTASVQCIQLLIGNCAVNAHLLVPTHIQYALGVRCSALQRLVSGWSNMYRNGKGRNPWPYLYPPPWPKVLPITFDLPTLSTLLCSFDSLICVSGSLTRLNWVMHLVFLIMKHLSM